MIVEQKICYMFNKFFSAFVKDLKNMDASLKAVVKKNFKVIDKSSEEYYAFFWQNVHPKYDAFLEEEDAVDDVELVRGITVKSVLDVISGDDVVAFWNYVYTLITLGYLYTEVKATSEPEGVEGADVSEGAMGALFAKVVAILSLVQKGQDASADISDIVDDDVRKLVSKIKPSPQGQEEVKLDGTEFLQNIDNSKIAELAKEISKDIDISQLNIEKPEDISKLLDFSGSNSFISDVVGKVSSKITEKIANGEINQNDLMSEAMSMMSMLNGAGAGAGGSGGSPMGGIGGIADMIKGLGGMGGLGGMMNNPMFSEMMKAAKKGNVQTRNQSGSRRGGASARDRLRKKLDEKKKGEQQQEQQE